MQFRFGGFLRRHRQRFVFAAGILAVLWLALFIYHVRKSLPSGMSFAGDLHRGNVEFLFDITYEPMIDSADRFVVIDMFLFNDEHTGDRQYRPLTDELTDRLIARKAAASAVDVTFITDPINNFYGAYTLPQIERLRDAGINVVMTRLTRLRDSNPLYSAGWRLVPRWFGTAGPGLVPHPLSSRGQRVTARSYLKLLNFKANHRKLIVTEHGCLVSSANPHDASSFHSNIAFALAGPICQDILEGERNLAAFSGGVIGPHRVTDVGQAVQEPTIMRYVTEGRIRTALLQEIGRAEAGDRIDIAVFYLSERSIIEALIDATSRGATLRVVLDPNKDAFGREKGGIPNRPVASELRDRSNGRIAVRWYDTHGEQFHTKLAVFTRGDSVTVVGGSANFTRRNVGDYNLEANVRLWTHRQSPLARALAGYFERIWSNRDGHYTVEFASYRDDAWFKRVLYRFQEFTGMCTY
jgi:HKD family nuclease